MERSKLSRYITWRVSGIMLFFNVLIIVVILWSVLDISLMNSSMRGQYVIDGVESNIASMMKVIQVVGANNRAEVERNLESPDQVFDALEREIQTNKYLIGCFAAFEPDYFKDQGRWFEAYVYHGDSTRFDHRQIGSQSHDYFNSVWYEKGLSLDRQAEGYLTVPYFDNSVNNTVYCSYVLPIVDRQGRKVGVYGVDLNYLWLNNVIADVEKVVKREFFDSDESLQDSNGIYFSIQILDSKGNRIIGSDSLDVNILKAEQKDVFVELGMKNLKGTPYYINSKPIAYTDWTVAVIQHRTLVFTWGVVLALFIVFCMGIGSYVIFFFTSRSIRQATQPLGFLSESAQEVAKGNFDAPLPMFTRNDEVAQLRDSFGTMQQSLKQYVEDLKASTAAKASIESELKVAHKIQMSMIPKKFPAFPDRKDIELYASLTPAKAVGGDLYDYFIHDEKLFFCIGDVTGKGVPASLVMAVSRTLFRNITAHTDEPKRIVEAMNVSVCEGNENCMFVTLFVGVLDMKTGHLRYCNAGHESPYVQGTPLHCDANLPVGLMSDFEYTEQETDLAAGTTIFLYTDGLTEAEDANHKLFGKKRTSDLVATFSGTSQQLIETMTDAVHQYVGDTEQSDDLTMLAFTYKG